MIFLIMVIQRMPHIIIIICVEYGGQPMTYGGTGWESSNPECNFMFPGYTDPSFAEEWTEITAGNDPADRRFTICRSIYTGGADQ